MLVQYSYNNAMDVIELLKANKIASLCMKDQNDVPIIEYELISDLSIPEQAESKRILGESLSERLYLIKLLHDFVVSKSAGRYVHLDLSFNTIRTKKLMFTHCLVGNMICADMGNTEYEEAMHAIRVLERTLTRMGITDQQMVNVYRKEGIGRSKKQIPLTLGNVLEYIRKAINQ